MSPVAASSSSRGGHSRIDLARVNTEIWKDVAPALLVDVAVFCDGDGTHTASISYFTYVRLEGREPPSPPSQIMQAVETHRAPDNT